MSKGEFSRKIVYTQTIVDTMLKDSPPAIRSTHRTHRTYAPEFKARLVAACQQPGVSIAALAGQHGMNANVLHRWLKEHAQSARHQLNPAIARPARIATSPPAGFVPLPLPLRLPAASHEPGTPALKVGLRKGALSMSITWPIDAAWLASAPMDMRAGTDSALARVVCVFGAAQPHTAYLFANRRGNRLKVLVHDGIGIWLAAR